MSHPLEKLSLPEVYKSLGRGRRAELRKELARATDRLPQTVWNWTSGNTQPSSILERRAVAKVVNRCLCINSDADTLFPEE